MVVDFIERYKDPSAPPVLIATEESKKAEEEVPTNQSGDVEERQDDEADTTEWTAESQPQDENTEIEPATEEAKTDASPTQEIASEGEPVSEEQKVEPEVPAFVPAPDWIASWVSKIPITSSIILIRHL
jgi:hypothetical protein